MTAPMPEELTPGFVFGAYVIQECIGRGGMARVYRAEHMALQKAVALKVLDQWVLDKPGGKERFLREARTAAAIKHPNVVDISDIGVWRERPYIVMELLSGCDLEKTLLRRGPLPDAEVAALALPLIAGMMAVHDAGVVHRDIKPSNIFLCNASDGEVVPKVLDFGISKFSDDMREPVQGLTNTREIVGTPAYMAPEALNGARELGPPADQYSLGAVLYDCVVGHPPYEGATLLELLKAIAVGTVAAPRTVRPTISNELEQAILRAISNSPEARFESLREFGRALWPLADERSRMIWDRTFGPSNDTVSMWRKRRSLVPRAWQRHVLPGLGIACMLSALVIVWRCTGDEQNASTKVGDTTVAPTATTPGSTSPAPRSAEPRERETADSTRAAARTAPEAVPATIAPNQQKERAKHRLAVRKQALSPRARPSDSVALLAATPRPTAAAPKVERAAGSSTGDLDPDLGELFALPAETPPAAAADEPDLGGLFPGAEARSVGVNGSPLTD